MLYYRTARCAPCFLRLRPNVYLMVQDMVQEPSAVTPPLHAACSSHAAVMQHTGPYRYQISYQPLVTDTIRQIVCVFPYVNSVEELSEVK